MQIVVSLVRDRDLSHAIRSLYGIDRARRIQRSLEPQCLSGFRKDENSRILHSDVLIVADAGEFVFYDCIYEELLQSLGPINDDTTVPWSMFNDNVQMGFFDLYDQYLLNILYDRRIRPGMTRAEVEALLPEVLPQVRAWVVATPRRALEDASLPHVSDRLRPASGWTSFRRDIVDCFATGGNCTPFGARSARRLRRSAPATESDRTRQQVGDARNR